MKIFKIATFLLVLLWYLSFAGFTFASPTDGTIDATDKYAWGENIGWIDFGTTQGNVHIIDSELTGYAWGENVGWISLNCSNTNSCGAVNYKVSNDGNGILSGYAFSENTGWINFNPAGGGVTINTSGEFLGYAWGENIGWIVFNCTTTNSCGAVNYKVKTDWRPISARTTSTPAQAGSTGGGVSHPPEEVAKTDLIQELKQGVKKISEKIVDIGRQIAELSEYLVPEFLRPQPPEEEKLSELPPVEEVVSKEAPLSMQGKWSLLSRRSIESFALSPLPREINILAQKFPRLEKTLKQVGVRKLSDVEKLKSVKLNLPGLTERLGLPTTEIEPGKFALPKGVPVNQLSAASKTELPTEIVFTRAGGETIDLNINLSMTNENKVHQEIKTVSDKPLRLVVKPEKPVKSVKGYIVFKQKKSSPSSFNLPINSLTASVIFSNPVFAQAQQEPVRIEELLVLTEFEYTDPDGDGIYTAEIKSPTIEGEYEIITVMDYQDPKLGTKEIRLTTVVDPEGYIYEKQREKETRIPGAVVSLFWLNTETKQYELWPAKEYQQENPQVTDVTGKYSFLVPEGLYYLKVETSGYLIYDGKPFQVKEGSGVHFNIELRTKYWWLKIIDWKTIILIIVVLLLLYNFYRDKIREKSIKHKNL